jgi:hypothetical protein
VKAPVLIFTVALAASAVAKPRTVTLDVKDGEARVILKDMQKQCGIRNLVIDPDVRGSGTFYFREVPCETAFRAVFRTLGLTGQVETNLVTVEPR